MGQPASHAKPSELSIIADQLAALAEGLRSGGQMASPPPSQDDEAKRTSFLELAKQTYAERRKRDGVLGSAHLLGEPAWDILLDLYIAQAQAHEVSVSSACIGSAVPPTTGLRWLGVLQEEGLVERINDPDDQRRVLVHLTQLGLDRMDTYFSAVSGANNPEKREASTQAALAMQHSALLGSGARLS